MKWNENHEVFRGKHFSQTYFTILNGKYSETDCKIDLIYEVEIAIQSW